MSLEHMSGGTNLSMGPVSLKSRTIVPVSLELLSRRTNVIRTNVIRTNVIRTKVLQQCHKIDSRKNASITIE